MMIVAVIITVIKEYIQYSFFLLQDERQTLIYG